MEEGPYMNDYRLISRVGGWVPFFIRLDDKSEEFWVYIKDDYLGNDIWFTNTWGFMYTTVH